MTDQSLTQPVKGVASPTLHRLILISERLAGLTWPAQVVVAIGYTAMVTLVWGWALDSFSSGSVIALIGLVFTVIDWIGLAQLPRRRRSFGPVAPGLILFGGLRCVIAIALALFASHPVFASTLLLGGHLALTGYALDSMWGEPFRLGVTRLTYRSPKLDGAPPIRIVHLTDFHVERLTRREEKVLALLDQLRPDLIVYTGDLLSFSYVDDPAAQADCRELMSKLRAPLGVFAVPGTPLVDTESALVNVLGGLDNISLLRDCAVSLPEYPRLNLIGLNCTHDPSIDGPKLEQAVDGLSPDDYTLLLYHAPDLMPEAARCGIDLVLCGHTHGGQIRLPLFGALATSSIYWKRYEMGEYREGNTTMVVSRGIGMEGKGIPRMRFLCPPEIELIELRGTRQAEETLRERSPAREADTSQPRPNTLSVLSVLRPMIAGKLRR
jgi:predicted MPP superfamily phosphohydrolase